LKGENRTVEITFYGGVNEIGGNKILLEDGDTKVFLDFGMSFGRRGVFYEEFLNPRTANGMGDFLRMGLIPDLKGVYREDLLRHSGLEVQEPDIDAVLLSHAHADHSNYISFLHGGIPVHCGETALRILEAVDESTQRNLESEVLNFKERPLFDYRAAPTERKITTFKTGDRLKIGGLEVEPVHVDHSVPGAYGFIIHTSAGAVIYTGDLRLHGTHAEMTGEFIERAAEAEPIAMITEGTRMDIQGKEHASEARVYAESKEQVLDTKKLALADFNFKDADRLRTFYNIARDTGRKFVISFKHACFLKRYAKDEKLDVPPLDDPHILIYKQRRKTGTYDDKDYKSFERQFLGMPNLVTAPEIREMEDKILMVLNFWSLNELVDLDPGPGSTYIHSLSEAFNEEMAISQARMDHWLEHFGLRKVQSHCSGHACGAEIKELIAEIDPKTLFPIHTEHPKLFRDEFGAKVVMPKEGTTYEVK